MKKFKDVKKREFFPLNKSGEIDWYAVWNENNGKPNCDTEGHIFMAPPHCDEGYCVCYKCDLKVKNE